MSAPSEVPYTHSVGGYHKILFSHIYIYIDISSFFIPHSSGVVNIGIGDGAGYLSMRFLHTGRVPIGRVEALGILSLSLSQDI